MDHFAEPPLTPTIFDANLKNKQTNKNYNKNKTMNWRHPGWNSNSDPENVLLIKSFSQGTIIFFIDKGEKSSKQLNVV